MTIVGFNFNKVSIERFASVKGKISISNNVSIVSVEKTPLPTGKDEALKFGFEFTSTYSPKVGLTDLRGEVIFMASKKEIEDILAQWKKEKKVPQDLMTAILNNVLQKCNIQALILSKDVNLPPPIPLPKVKETQA